jgi:hypothetical protein
MHYASISLRPTSKEDLDGACITLFELLCERRSLIPLTFLMRSWPVPTCINTVSCALVTTLLELIARYSDVLDEDEQHQIRTVIGIAQRSLH